MSSLIGGIVPPSAVLAALLYKGTDDLESRVIVEFNSGLHYDPARRGFPTFGVVRLLGVPVYDFATGLGERLPNFLSNPGAMPWPLISQWFTADELPVLRLFVTLSVVWLIIRSVLGAVKPRGSRVVSGLVLLAVVAPVGGYGIHIDWLYQAEQYLACAGIIILFAHPAWVQTHPVLARTANKHALGLTYLLATLTAGHLDWWPWLIWPAFGLLLTRGHRLIPVLGVPRSLLCIVPSAFSSALHAGDLLMEQWDGARPYVGHGSTSGIPMLERLRSGSASGVIQNVLEPFPQLLAQVTSWDWIGGPTWSKYGMLEGPLVLVAAMSLVLRSESFATKSLRRYLLLVAATSAFGLYAVTWISHIPLLAPGSLSQLMWVVRVPLILLAADLLSNKSASPRSGIRLVSLLGAVLGLLAATATSLAFVGRPWLRLQPYLTLANERAPVEQLTVLGRVSVSGSLDSQFRSSWLKSAVGVESVTALARSGVPVVQHRNMGRATAVFVPMSSQERFQGVLSQDHPICESDVLDFLAVAVLLEESSDTTRCLGETARLFAPPRIADSAYSEGAVVRRREGGRYSYFWTNQVDPGAPGCALLVDSCLARPNVARSGTSDVPPLQVQTSDEGTRVMYTLRAEAPRDDFSWLLIPLEFDPQLTVRLEAGAVELATRNHAGLLAVDTHGIVTPELLIISLQPDWRSWCRAIQPWLIATALLALTLMVLWTRERQRL